MRKSQVELLREAKAGRAAKAASLDFMGLLELLLGGKPNPTQLAFILSPDQGKAYKGPAGCAKTSTGCAAAWLRALLEPGSKGIVARHDYNDLFDTTHLRMTEMLNRLPKGTLLDRNKSAPEKWYIRSPLMRRTDGGEYEGEPSQITFMGLKEGLGSLELNWAFLDEMDEMPELRVREVFARFRGANSNNFALMGAFNPPDKQHWLYEACTGLDDQDQPTGRAPWLTLFEPEPKENVRNLRSNYYEDMAHHLTADQARRLIDGEWGGTFEGKPVYPEFSYELHTGEFQFQEGMPLLRFWDFGYTRPYCGWFQFVKGRLIGLGEVLGHNIMARPFARQIKGETTSRFPRAHLVLDFGDPAVKHQKDTGSALKDFLEEGIMMHYRSSKIEEGLRIVRMQLSQLMQGRPVINLHRSKQPILVSAMRGGYANKKDKSEPKKDGFYDHPADAFRYGCLHVFGGGGLGSYIGRPLANLSYRPEYDQPTSLLPPDEYESDPYP